MFSARKTHKRSKALSVDISKPSLNSVPKIHFQTVPDEKLSPSPQSLSPHIISLKKISPTSPRSALGIVMNAVDEHGFKYESFDKTNTSELSNTAIVKEEPIKPSIKINSTPPTLTLRLSEPKPVKPASHLHRHYNSMFSPAIYNQPMPASQSFHPVMASRMWQSHLSINFHKNLEARLHKPQVKDNTLNGKLRRLLDLT